MERTSSEYKAEQGERISLGEEFSLFDPTRTEQYFDDYLQQNRSFSEILFHLNARYQIPLLVRASVVRVLPKIAFTPFSPETSYRVDERDLTIEGRKQKYKEVDRLTSLTNPFTIVVTTGMVSDLEERGILKNEEGIRGFNDDLDELLQRIHLIVKFPQEGQSVAYEAECDLTDDGFKFEQFHPADMPPFPVANELLHRDNQIGSSGIPLLVNGDLQRLQHIKGTFILTPQEKGSS